MRATAVLAVLVVVAAVGLALSVPQPPTPMAVASSAEVPVTSTVLGCPTTAQVAASVRQVRAGVRAAPVRAVASGADGARTVVAHGAGAADLLAWRTDRGPGVTAVAPCRAPGAGWWFAGAGAGLDHRSLLVLGNPGEGTAVVDVGLVGVTGDVDRSALEGITIPAGGTRVVPLVAVAPGSEELTVHVVARQGRVVAHVRDLLRAPGGTGWEWLPPSAPPSTDLRLVGLPRAPGRRTLLVANPGDRQALVRAQVVTTHGAFVPTGADEVSVDPGSVATLDLPASVRQGYAAVRVRADVPVLATVRSRVGPDLAYAAAVPTAAGALAAPASGPASTLLVMGTDAPSGGQATAWSASGHRLGVRGLSVPPSGLSTWTLPPGTAYVVLDPDPGRGALAAGVVTNGPGVSALPLVRLPTTEQRPAVVMRSE